jgi:hypothetical protein
VTDGVASPPPTNATAALHWVGPGATPPSGDFGTANNWQPPAGESPRVPASRQRQAWYQPWPEKQLSGFLSRLKWRKTTDRT